MNNFALTRGHAAMLVMLASFCLLVAISWVGFIASDDATYAGGAYGWIEQFPFVGGHGTIRYPITIPIALSFLSFGQNEIALALPTLLYMLGVLAIVWHMVVRHVGLGAAAISSLLAISCPLFAVQASIANADMPELFYQLASFALFLRGLDRERPAPSFFLAGIMAGIGFLTRETSIFIALFYAPLFLAGYRASRLIYLWIAAGFLAIWAVELAYLGAMTGDPLYRVNISLHHDSTIDRSIDVAGNLILHPAIDPLLVLLFNQEFMLLFWLAIPAGMTLCWSSKLDAGERRFVRLLGLYGLCIFLASGAAVTLLPLNPRYFSAPTLVACVLLGVALARLYARRRVLAGLILLGLVGSNALGIYAENRHSIFGVRSYADMAKRAGEVVLTDPMTRYRAEIPLKWNGASDRAVAAPPRPGALYFWNPRLATEPNAKMDALAAPRYARPDGQVVAVAQARPDIVLRGIEALGMRPLVPAALWTRLAQRHPAVELIRVSQPRPGRGPARRAGRRSGRDRRAHGWTPFGLASAAGHIGVDANL